MVNAILNNTKQKTNPYDTTAEVTRIEDGIMYVHIPGGVDETPVEMTISASPGDAVKVRVANGRAWVTGNQTAPPTDDTEAILAKLKALQAEKKAITATESAEQAAQAAAEATTSAGIAGRAASIAQAAAEAAQATADSKKVVFTSQPTPPYHVGDLWVDGGSMTQTMSDGTNDLITSGAELLEALILGSDSVTVKYCIFARTEGESFSENDWSLAATDDTAVNELREWFWHDSLGAHILGDATGYRNDLDSTGMHIVDTSTETEIARFAADGAQIGADDENHIEIGASGVDMVLGAVTGVHFGYGEVEGESGTTTSLYTTIGSRDTRYSIGDNSVAFGSRLAATKPNAFAEGTSNLVFASHAHAEGDHNTVRGSSAHAEGSYNSATGSIAHVEGHRSVASGDSSHAQNTYTVAASTNQTALGRFNVEDSNNVYAVIIGNGVSDNARSNALTVDWSGNVVLAGAVTTGSDIDWTELTLNSACEAYSTATAPHYKRKGDLVTLIGDVKPTAEIASGGTMTIGQLPAECYPAQRVCFLCQGSGRASWLCTIDTTGVITAARYRTEAGNQAMTTSSWLPFAITYMV